MPLCFSPAAFEEFSLSCLLPPFEHRGPSEHFCSLLHSPLQSQRNKRVLEFDTEPLLQYFFLCYYQVSHSNMWFMKKKKFDRMISSLLVVKQCEIVFNCQRCLQPLKLFFFFLLLTARFFKKLLHVLNLHLQPAQPRRCRSALPS